MACASIELVIESSLALRYPAGRRLTRMAEATTRITRSTVVIRAWS
jgi:hypothetical protein